MPRPGADAASACGGNATCRLAHLPSDQGCQALAGSARTIAYTEYRHPMRAVLDTNVLVAAVGSRRGASNAVLIAAFEGRFDWLVSTPLFLEYEDVLLRPEVLSRSTMTSIAMSRFLTDVAAAATPVDLHFRWRPLLKDPKDEMVLETAVNGRADALVTHNDGDFAAARAFDVEVLVPSRFLERIRK